MSASLGIPSSQSIDQLARRGAIWTVTCTLGRLVLAIGSAAVLARLLSLSDFGMMAIVASWTGLLLLVADIRLTWSIVQARDLDQVHLDTLFWLTFVLGLMAWCVSAVAAPLLAKFYQVEEVATMTLAMGSSLLFSNLAIVPMALLRRAIRQKTISQIHLIAFAWGSGVAMLAAWFGLGWWALVLQQLLGYVAVFSAAWWCSAYRPGRPGSLRTVVPLMKFGGCSSLANVFKYLQANVSTIAVGYFAGVTDLGYFSRALLLRNLPTQYTTSSFHDVMIPSVVELRDDPE